MDSSWETGTLCEDGESIVEWCHIVLLCSIGCFDHLMSLKRSQWVVLHDVSSVGGAINGSENSAEN